MRQMISFLALLVSLAAAAPAQADPAAVAAAVAHPDRFEQDIALDESRQPIAVLDFLGLQNADRVLDVMAGGGYYTELIARAVGLDGFVVGQNPPGIIERFSLAPIFERRGYGTGRIPNAEQLNENFASVELEPESYDFALFHLVLHDLWFEREPDLPRTDPGRFLAEVYRGLKPGGIVGIVDHVGVDADDPRGEVARNHRIAPEVVRAAMETAGFVLEAEGDILQNPEDTHELSVFDPAIRGNTDRFVYRFRKPAVAVEE